MFGNKKKKKKNVYFKEMLWTCSVLIAFTQGGAVSVCQPRNTKESSESDVLNLTRAFRFLQNKKRAAHKSSSSLPLTTKGKRCLNLCGKIVVICVCAGCFCDCLFSSALPPPPPPPPTPHPPVMADAFASSVWVCVRVRGTGVQVRRLL